MFALDWDLAPKCVCGPKFISYLLGESSILSAIEFDPATGVRSFCAKCAW